MKVQVRLPDQDQKIIKNTVLTLLKNDELVSIKVFGSRADLNKKGGDIDLLIEVSGMAIDKRRLQQNIRLKLHEKMGEQKMDIVIINIDASKNSEQENNFYAIINKDAKNIWIKE